MASIKGIIPAEAAGEFFQT